jgi:hypothetical protein
MYLRSHPLLIHADADRGISSEIVTLGCKLAVGDCHSYFLLLGIQPPVSNIELLVAEGRSNYIKDKTDVHRVSRKGPKLPPSIGPECP